MTRGKCPLAAEPVAKFHHGGKQDEKLENDLEPAFNSMIKRIRFWNLEIHVT